MIPLSGEGAEAISESPRWDWRRRASPKLAIDATIIRWFYQTVSNDIFRTVVRDGDSARTVWAKITGLFTDNKIKRATFLQQEFFGTTNDRLSTSVAYLRLEERRLKHLRARAAHTAFVAGFSRGAQTPAPRPTGPLPGFPAAGHQAGRRPAGPAGGYFAEVAVAVVAVAVVAAVAMLVLTSPPHPPQDTASTMDRRSQSVDRVVHAYSMPVSRAPTRASWGRVQPPTRRSTRHTSPPGLRPPRRPVGSRAPDALRAPPPLGIWRRWRPVHGHRRLRAYGCAPRDVWTSPVPSNSVYNYYLVILDDYSHFVWTFPLRRKSDVAATLTAFFVFVSTQFGRPIRALQTDNGKEFDNITIRSLLAAHGAVFRLTCPYTSPQNDRAEQMLRTLNEYVCTLLFHASMPPRFWPDALATATLLVNIRPCRVRWSYTPHHLLYGAPPYDDIFGCRCYPNIAATTAHKLAPRSLPCVFLGYPANTKGYRCYDPVSHRVLTSRHVYFDKLVFRFSRTLSYTSDDAPAQPSCGRAQRPCGLYASPGPRRLRAAAPRRDARRCTRPLGTPRGRYDAHKFSSERNQGYRTSRSQEAREGCWWRNVVRRNTSETGANVEPAQHNQSTLPQRNSEVVNLTGLLKTKD
ncbi:hypothetical protein QYE76_022787 [Lolium multiflorum]|uniref:Integrase catalytic domain-containing protein n=1 Tax=Lolium multiflorum TaxID=4521 RepID=A0AAD8VU37_LOLMU|nr:hypothetical protein QYE76_022787 [Lolium multiflorum]